MVDFVDENLLAQAVKGEHLPVDWDVWIRFCGLVLSGLSGIVASKTLVLVFDQPGSNAV